MLAGAIPELGGRTAGLMDHLLKRVDLARPIVAIVSPDVDPAEVQEFLDALEDWLGVEAGVLELDTDLEAVEWEQAGLLFLFGDDREAWIESLLGESGHRLERAFGGGAVVLPVGGAASIFGAEAPSDVRSDTLLTGLGWLPEAMILTDPEEAHEGAGRAWLQDEGRRILVVLEPDSILALGPDGQVEPWSDVAPEIMLGRGWAGP